MNRNEEEPPPIDPALASMVSGAIRAKARSAAFFMAVAVGSFVYLAADSGVPLWLVVVIGILGAILIAFFIALVWFWLRFLSPSARRKSTDA